MRCLAMMSAGPEYSGPKGKGGPGAAFSLDQETVMKRLSFGLPLGGHVVAIT
jgi:hypothetical protein